MIERITSLLRQIVGRIKKMIDYLLAWGNIYLPIGVVLILLALDKDGVDLWAFFICGGLFVLLGLVSMSKAWEKVKTQEEEDKKRFKELITEIKGLKQSLGAKVKKDEQQYNL